MSSLNGGDGAERIPVAVGDFELNGAARKLLEKKERQQNEGLRALSRERVAHIIAHDPELVHFLITLYRIKVEGLEEVRATDEFEWTRFQRRGNNILTRAKTTPGLQGVSEFLEKIHTFRRVDHWSIRLVTRIVRGVQKDCCEQEMPFRFTEDEMDLINRLLDRYINELRSDLAQRTESRATDIDKETLTQEVNGLMDMRFQQTQHHAYEIPAGTEKVSLRA